MKFMKTIKKIETLKISATGHLKILWNTLLIWGNVEYSIILFVKFTCLLIFFFFYAFSNISTVRNSPKLRIIQEKEDN